MIPSMQVTSDMHRYMPTAVAGANRRTASRLRKVQHSSRFGKHLATLFWTTLATCFFLLGGFLDFTQKLPVHPVKAPIADAIVVLTGGPDRLEAGLQLLEDGKGRRLLISGVHAEIQSDDLAKLVDPAYAKYFDCCVDLDYAALNTRDNARETLGWAQSNRFSSVILVTSSYHLPRAMLALKGSNGATQFIAYPVTSDEVHLEEWWAWPGTAKLLGLEYLKYLASLIQYRVDLLR